MADDKGAPEETLREAELVEGLEKKKISGKKIVIAVAGLVVIALVVMGIMFMFGGDDEPTQEPGQDAVLDQMAEDAASANEQLEQDVPPEQLQLLFYTLPDLLINLNTGDQGSSFLRARVTLEVDRESYKAELETKLPRILDEFNNYVRELRPEDLEGSAGFQRLKEELLMRINQAVAPTRVKDVLFEEFLVQG